MQEKNNRSKYQVRNSKSEGRDNGRNKDVRNEKSSGYKKNDRQGRESNDVRGEKPSRYKKNDYQDRDNKDSRDSRGEKPSRYKKNDYQDRDNRDSRDGRGEKPSRYKKNDYQDRDNKDSRDSRGEKPSRYKKNDYQDRENRDSRDTRGEKPTRYKKNDYQDRDSVDSRNEKSGRYKRDDYQGRDSRDDRNEKSGRYKRNDFDSRGDRDRRYNREGDVEGERIGGNRKLKRKVTVGCPVYEQCGNCFGQEITYAKRLSNKQKMLEKLIGEYCELEPIIEMEHPYHYKNRVDAVFHHDRDGKPICGVYKPGAEQVVAVENCYINDKKAFEIIVSIRDMLQSFKIKTYDKKTGHGLLRYVSVRRGLQSGEIMVVLVLSSHIMPSKNNFIKALRKLHPEIETVIVNENYKTGDNVLGDKETVVYGKGFILDHIAGKAFRISSKSAYPVNPVQAEKLYHKALEYADFKGDEIVLDAYCGIGTVGILASDYVRKVISVEVRPEVVRDGVSNVKRNQIKNVDFYTKEVAEFVSQVARSEKEQIDVAFIDPNKTGCEKDFMDALSKLDPGKVVYISRNPISLSNDLRYFRKLGYKVQKAVGIDMMPWTECVDTVVLLSRKKSI